MKRTYTLAGLLFLSACAKREALVEDRHHSQNSERASRASAQAVDAIKKPSSPEEWGETFFKKGDYQRAIAYLSQAIKKNPSSATLWRNLGSAYALAQDYNNSILCYERALKRNPHDIKTHYNLSLVHNFKGSPEDLKLAEDSAKQGLEDDPNHAPLHSSLGNIYADESKDEQALKEYEKAIELNPKDPITRFNKGALHFQRHEIKEAEAEYFEALKIDPTTQKRPRIWRLFISCRTAWMRRKS